jgi:hypothetical protein
VDSAGFGALDAAPSSQAVILAGIGASDAAWRFEYEFQRAQAPDPNR